ncbi:carotenoid biosynthesis protein [Massilia cavernae]|uniref:carotenoid biosynthesis protein n=1 Tax=Massilia cavernae TaxID=2320864 RepID=UPI001E622F48|nr:carotenoid biosynthesis protein [Massilia cavernae]
MSRLPFLAAAFLAVFLLLTAARGHADTTSLLIGSSILMFACCLASAAHLLGVRAALRFAVIGVVVGWFAEQMGASYGWFFGRYTYTEVLGPRIGQVPFIIPLMWFALSYVAYVTANLIVWQAPVDGPEGLGHALVMSLLAAMIVTAYDLGADPYMVYTLKAWIMTKTDGWWFGETLEGFFGWAFVSFVIVSLFRMTLRKRAPVAALPVQKWHALVPLAIYGGSMVFQMFKGSPVETRTVALFAMGIPLLCALCGWWRWSGGTGVGADARAGVAA